MTLQLNQPKDFLRFVDGEKAVVDRRIFTDPDIYQVELERIFARAWNFMCHDSQIPNPGDFFMTFIGEDRVIVVRDNDMQPQVLINSCRHRGNAVCRAEEGHATSFMCTYHGWTYDLKGNLVGVPGFKEVYHEELDRENWGLIKAAKVDSYHGFVFATMDETAPDLDEYLGDVGRLSIDELAMRGDMAIVGGIQKFTIPCNWKFAADNVWDWYHAPLTHSSAVLTGMFPFERKDNQYFPEHIAVLGDYGHAIGGPAMLGESERLLRKIGNDPSWQERPEAKQALGTVGAKAAGHPHIFPNMWVATGSSQISLRHPKGPYSTEIWWFTVLNKELPPQHHRMLVGMANHVFGPAGMLEQEDGENWGESTRAMSGVMSSKFPLHYAMNLGHGEVTRDETGPGYILTGVNEHAQLWHYRNWAAWMAAESWEDLKSNRPSLPEDRV
ncbi:MAG: SRPBCC family protein [Dehalococcoidia bacterium]